VIQRVERIDRIYAVQFSPTSDLLAVGGFDGKVAIFRISSPIQEKANQAVAELSRPGLVLCLDWSPSGRFIAIGGSDKCCAVVDCLSWKVVNETLRSTSVQSVKWNQDGTCLAIGDRAILILEGGGSFNVYCEICNTKQYDQQEGSSTHGTSTSKYRLSALCWSPDDGKYLAVGGTDGSCMVVETQGWALVHEVRRQGDVSCLAWGQFQLPSGEYRRYLAIGDDTNSVALLKAGTETDASSSAESDDLSSAASSSRASSHQSTESQWILREDSFRDVGEPVPPSPPGLKPCGTITSVAFSRASMYSTASYLAFASDDCSLTIIATKGWKVAFVSYDIHTAINVFVTSSPFLILSPFFVACAANGVCQANPDAGLFKL
jgi:WD40 repeat protein